MWKRLAFGVVGLGVVMLSVTLGWQAWQYVTVGLPMGRLPASESDIAADWARVQPWLHESRREPNDDRLVALVEAAIEEDAHVEVVRDVARWIDRGGQVPLSGCALHEGLGPDPPEPSMMDLFDVSRALIDSGEPEAAWELAEQLRRRELLGLAVAKAIQETVVPGHGIEPSDLFAVLVQEVSCMDTVLEALLEGTLDEDVLGSKTSPFLSVPKERLKFRHYAASLLLALHPIKDDAEAQVELLESYPKLGDDAPLAGMLLNGMTSVGGDLLLDSEW